MTSDDTSNDKDTDKSGVEERASFYSRDPHAGSSSKDDKEGGSYNSEERRRRMRRSNTDRREEVRFEPGKDDRRQNTGRRKDDKQPKFW